LLDPSVQRASERRMRAVAADGAADDVQRVDARRAFPDETEMSVADELGVGPVLDVAVAAAHLHGAGGDRHVVAAGAVLHQGGEDAELRLVAPGHRHGRRDGDREGLFGRHHELEQLPPRHRVIDQGAAEGAAVACHLQRLVQAAPHHAGGAEAVRQAREVDLIHHLPEAAAGLAEDIGDGAFHDDLAGGHGARAELVLEPHDPVAVAAAVLEPSRHHEQRQAGIARGRALAAGEQQHDVMVGAGTEPLVAPQLPVVAGAMGRKLDAGKVGAAGLLGHELRALEQGVHVLAEHARQVTLLHALIAVLLDQQDRSIGH
jgi:hypothetical protein